MQVSRWLHTNLRTYLGEFTGVSVGNKNGVGPIFEVNSGVKPVCFIKS